MEIKHYILNKITAAVVCTLIPVNVINIIID